MTIKFYGSDTSVFSRAVWMALDVLQLDYELIVTKASVGDTRKPDFLKVILQELPLHAVSEGNS